MKISIKKKIISNFSNPYVVAEMSGNHNQSIRQAFKLIKEAHKSGADAIKIQTYSAESMVLNIAKAEFVIKDKKSPWYGNTLYDLYKKASTPKSWIEKIIKYSNQIGITCFASVFDLETVDYLEKFNIPAYKISSFELNYIPLIEKVAKTKKPIILSTGMANDKEIEEAIKVIHKKNNKQIILLKCTSEYPANLQNCNLEKIEYFKKKFKCLVGYSDHTKGSLAPVVAISKGAVMIEKHFKLSDKVNSVDSKFSLDPVEFKQMVLDCKNAKKILGNFDHKLSKSEIFNKKFRRSIYISKDVKKNQKISDENIKIIRSQKGLHPREYYSILGKKYNRDLSLGKPLKRIYCK